MTPGQKKWAVGGAIAAAALAIGYGVLRRQAVLAASLPQASLNLLPAGHFQGGHVPRSRRLDRDRRGREGERENGRGEYGHKKKHHHRGHKHG